MVRVGFGIFRLIFATPYATEEVVFQKKRKTDLKRPYS
jgi:hypothetical protein